jgi:hypothetical protein
VTALRQPAWRLAVILLLAAGAASAQERLIEAGKVFPMLDKFYAMPAADRSLLVVSYFVVHDGKPASDLHAALVVGGRRTPVPVGGDGKVQRLPTAAELAAHAQLAVDAPASVKFSIRLSLDTAIPPARQIPAAACAQAIVQANDAVHRAAGVMAMLAPKVKAVTFVGAGSGVAVFADGRKTPLPEIKGSPAYDPDRLKDVRSIELAKIPSLISLE